MGLLPRERQFTVPQLLVYRVSVCQRASCRHALDARVVGTAAGRAKRRTGLSTRQVVRHRLLPHETTLVVKFSSALLLHHGLRAKCVVIAPVCGRNMTVAVRQQPPDKSTCWQRSASIHVIYTVGLPV